jgi:hypothetical protein
MSHDPEDDQPEVELGRKFYFRDKELAAYSFNHRAALFRMGDLTDYEFCTYLIRMLLIPIREVDCIRTPEQLSDFRINAGKWADDNNVSKGDGLTELQSLVDSILGQLAKAEELLPKATAKKKANRQKPPQKRSRT